VVIASRWRLAPAVVVVVRFFKNLDIILLCSGYLIISDTFRKKY
jgi:hypothetical protein